MHCYFHTCVFVCVILRTWIRHKVVFYLQQKTTRRMGQSRWIVIDQIPRKRTPSFPSHESIVSRNAQKAKAVENCRYTVVPMGRRLKLCFAQLFLSISSVAAEQSHKYAKNTKLFTIERCNPLWEDNQVLRLCQAWSRQTCFWIMMILHMKFFYCSNTEHELKSYHNKTDWAHFVRMQDSWLQLKSDSISWRKTLQNSHNSQMQLLVVSTLCQETKIHLNQKVGSEGAPKLDPYWKLQHVACT